MYIGIEKNSVLKLYFQIWHGCSNAHTNVLMQMLRKHSATMPKHHYRRSMFKVVAIMDFLFIFFFISDKNGNSMYASIQFTVNLILLCLCTKYIDITALTIPCINGLYKKHSFFFKKLTFLPQSERFYTSRCPDSTGIVGGNT